MMEALVPSTPFATSARIAQTARSGTFAQMCAHTRPTAIVMMVALALNIQIACWGQTVPTAAAVVERHHRHLRNHQAAMRRTLQPLPVPDTPHVVTHVWEVIVPSKVVCAHAIPAHSSYLGASSTAAWAVASSHCHHHCPRFLRGLRAIITLIMAPPARRT